MNTSQRFHLFVVLIVISAIVCLGTEYAKQTHIRRVESSMATPTIPSTKTLQQEMGALATANTVIEDGFTIENLSKSSLSRVLFSCKVDGQEQVFEWASGDALFDSTSIKPGTALEPESLLYVQLTAAQYKNGGLLGNPQATSANLNHAEMDWLLNHHKVTGCDVFKTTVLP